MSNGVPAIQDDFQTSNSDAEQLRYLLNYAVLAPSGHNTQPWLFKLGDNYVDLFADRTRALPVVDPQERELTISCGAALEHLVVASRHYGRDLLVEDLPDPSNAAHLAHVRFGPEMEPSVANEAMFRAIPKRRTTRTKYVDRMLPDDLCDTCRTLANESGVQLVFVTDQDRRAQIADLVAEGDRIQFADPRFRRELAAWLHSRRAASDDGMSGEGFGMPDVLSPVGALVIRTFDMGKRIAASDKVKIMKGSPMLAVFGTLKDGPADWLNTGRALSKVLLTLTASGATAAYLNQPVEVEELRPGLTDTIDSNYTPQLLTRFGYGPKVRSTVRRSVADVLI